MRHSSLLATMRGAAQPSSKRKKHDPCNSKLRQRGGLPIAPPHLAAVTLLLVVATVVTVLKLEHMYLTATPSDIMAPTSQQRLLLATHNYLAWYNLETQELKVLHQGQVRLLWLQCHLQDRLPCTRVLHACMHSMPFCNFCGMAAHQVLLAVAFGCM